MTIRVRKRMKLINILIVVKDIEKSKQFYHDLFGLIRFFVGKYMNPYKKKT